MKKLMVAAAIAVVTLSLGARSASAQSPADRETARTLMDEGDGYVAKQQFEDALKVYEAAHAIMHVPTTGIDVALTLTTLGRLVEAREVALEVTRLPGEGTESKLFAEARHDAGELADRLSPKIPTLRLELPNGVDPGTIHATIDGEDLPSKALAVPRRLNPGKHTIRVDVPGRDLFTRDVELNESARAVLNVDSRTTTFSMGENKILGLPPLAFAGLAASALGLGVGTITGFASLGKASDARSRCGPDTKNCDPAAADAISASKTLGWVSTASFALAVAGGALATYALVIIKSDSKVGSSGSGKSVGIHVSAMSAFLKGTF